MYYPDRFYIPISNQKPYKMIDVLRSIYQYCDDHSKGLDPVLSELERTTHLETANPRMLSGYLQGLFLQTISVLKSH